MPLNASGPRRVVLTTDAVGGVWTYSLDLARGLGEAGVAVQLVVLGPPPALHQQHEAAAIDNLRLVTLDLPLDWTAGSPAELEDASRTLFALLRSMGGDLIHLNSPGLALAADGSVPLVLGLHSCVASWWEAVHPGEAMPPDLAWRTEALRQAMPRADAVLVPSMSFAGTAIDLYGCGDRLAAVHNGRTAREPGGGAFSDPEIVMTAGRLWDEAKNMATLDAAAAFLDGPVYAAGPVVSAESGNSADIEYLKALGNLSSRDMRSWLSRAGIFVSPALYEPFGLGVLEAAQAGCALILSDIPTFRELWQDAAIFVPARDAGAFASAIREVSGNAERCAALGHAARVRAGRYKLVPMIDSTMDIYARLITTNAVRQRIAL